MLDSDLTSIKLKKNTKLFLGESGGFMLAEILPETVGDDRIKITIRNDDETDGAIFFFNEYEAVSMIALCKWALEQATTTNAPETTEKQPG